MAKNYQLTTADWSEARKLLSMTADELHAMRLSELHGGANLLRAVGDVLCQRSLALRKLSEARAAVGAVD
jgi:hypothetical protein